MGFDALCDIQTIHNYDYILSQRLMCGVDRESIEIYTLINVRVDRNLIEG